MKERKMKDRENTEIKDPTQQKITKARDVFVWVLVYDQDGEYIQTSKAKLVNALRSHPEALDESKFVLREDGDLYVN